MRSRIGWTILALGAVLILVVLMAFNLSALPEPGRLETRFSELAKRFFIHHASCHGVPPRPLDTKASVAAGLTDYGLDCSMCHDNDGRARNPPGRWMYPRAANLTSDRVQSYSDQELFWIIQNGIRLTGMPAFGKAESADHIWDLVNYVRALPGNLGNEESTR
jgi:cytochrome c553